MRYMRQFFFAPLLTTILWGILLPFASSLIPSSGWQVLAQTEDMELDRLLRENDLLAALDKYKDSDDVLRVKLANLRAINASRREAGLSPLKLDLLASRVGNKHALDMIANDFIGHWSSNGDKPYHRYSFAGGRDHIGENVYGSWMTGGTFEETLENLEKMMLEAHTTFMAEKPPADGHRQTVLTPYHTHVGIGVALKGNQFRYAQEFVDRYLVLEPVQTQVRSGSTITLKGRTLSERYGPYVLLVYYEPLPRPLANPKNQPYQYGDYSDTVFAKVAPWKIKYNPRDRSFELNLELKNARPGSYYVMLYVKEDPSTIPYDKPSSWSTEGAIPATGIVFVVQ